MCVISVKNKPPLNLQWRYPSRLVGLLGHTQPVLTDIWNLQLPPLQHVTPAVAIRVVVDIGRILLKTCTKCLAKVPSTAKFCNRCRSTSFKSKNVCSSCKAEIPNSKVNFCPKCGKKLNLDAKIKMKQIIAVDGVIHTCNICVQKVKYDLVTCPSCLNTFHFNHLANWILSDNSCPVCKVKLELVD